MSNFPDSASCIIAVAVTNLKFEPVLYIVAVVTGTCFFTLEYPKASDQTMVSPLINENEIDGIPVSLSTLLISIVSIFFVSSRLN
jgi:hypothetical protein